MSISDISSSGTSSFMDQIQQFRQGKTNLQKSDLLSLKEKLGAKGTQQSDSPFDALLNSFDQIDKNKDGISVQELSDFAKAQGITSETPESSSSGKSQGKSGVGRGFNHSLASMGLETKSEKSISVDDLSSYKAQLEKNGKTVPPELSEMIANFKTLDSNQDGKLTFHELGDYIKATRAAKQADASTGISKEDLVSMKAQIEKDSKKATTKLDSLINSFAAADTNQDGKIDPQEMAAYLKSQNADASTGTTADAPSKKSEKSVSVSDLEAFKAKLEKDGKTVPTELTQMIANFKTLDINGDGKLTFRELDDSIKASRQANGPAGVSKDDLVGIKDQITKSGQQDTSKLDSLINSFAAADTNQDGKIDPQELEAFLKSTAADPSTTAAAASTTSAATETGTVAVATPTNTGTTTSTVTDTSTAAANAANASISKNAFDLISFLLNQDSQKSGQEGSQKKRNHDVMGLAKKLIQSYGQSLSAAATGSLQITA